MTDEKPFRRMTLRQLITHAEKCSRDAIEHLHATMLQNVSDLRDLSRPVRRRSHYPTLVAVQNALDKLSAANDEVQALVDELHDQMQEIGDRAKREKVNRL